MKYCPHCRRPTLRRSGACPHCGGDLDADLPEDGPAKPATTSEAENVEGAKESPEDRLRQGGVRSPIDAADLDYFASWLKWDVPSGTPRRATPEPSPPPASGEAAEDGLLDVIVDAESLRLLDSEPPGDGAAAESSPGAGKRAFRSAETPRPGKTATLTGALSATRRAAAVDAETPGGENVADSLDGVGEVLEKIGEDGSPGAYGAARRRRSKTPPPPPDGGEVSWDGEAADHWVAATSELDVGTPVEDLEREHPKQDPRRPIEPTARAAWDAGRRAGLAEASHEVQHVIDSGSHRIVDLFRLDERLQALAAPIDPGKGDKRD